MKLNKNKLLEFRCMIYAIIISYVILDSCIGQSRKWQIWGDAWSGLAQPPSLSTSCVPRPRDNLSTGDVHTTHQTIGTFPNLICFVLLLQKRLILIKKYNYIGYYDVLYPFVFL